MTTVTDGAATVAEHESDPMVEAKSASNLEPEETQADSPANDARVGHVRRWLKIRWSRVVAYGVLPAMALLLAMVAGVAKWKAMESDDGAARTAAVQAATSSTIALLSYKPETVEQDLNKARDLLTGSFGDSYASLIRDVVIPGAQQRHVTAAATVPAAAAASASRNHAVVLVFIDQMTTVGSDPPTNSMSTVRVTLDKVGNQWLISQFDPI